FKEPTPIQEKVIPLLLETKRDVTGLAQTGTGKTAAFGLPLIELVDTDKREIQGLILCPTRELCLQINREMELFSKFTKDLRIVPVYGGKEMASQIRSIRMNPQLLVATPGRLVDLIKRGVVDISKLRYLVMDEADIMLNMGFRDELDFILASSPKERQTLLFSATMPPEVARIAKEYMTDPIEIAVGKKNAGVDTIEHYYYLVQARDRYNALKRLVDFNPGIYGLVFCRTRADTQIIADKMLKDGYNVDSLHGDMTQQQREFVMKKFRDQSLQILVATDIAARGLDVNNLTHVIHYELPDDIESYNHRSGRTGRAGHRGTSCAIVNMREKYKIKRIEKILGRNILEAPVPLGADICEQQLMHLIDRVQDVDVDEEEIAPYIGVIEDKLRDLDRNTLLKHFISMEFNRFLTYYGNQQDLQPVKAETYRDGGGARGARAARGGRDGGRSERDHSNVHYVHMNLNLGHRDRISPQHIISMINRSTKGSKVPIGRIDIGPTKSSVQIDATYASQVEEALSKLPFEGKKIRLDIQKDAPVDSDGGSFNKGGYSGGGGYGGARKGGGYNKRGKGGKPGSYR
ncbi:DEAD/DEAH box helicase, partial [Oceanispirochaeta sp.]|uniref:DEAD/DEAH box helicase n=1 Tax=Oceanispirochaeta sp. TaxID=2035350 RepID=UPI00262F530B